MVDYKSIGRRIALFRKEAKITQATLAEHLLRKPDRARQS